MFSGFLAMYGRVFEEQRVRAVLRALRSGGDFAGRAGRDDARRTQRTRHQGLRAQTPPPTRGQTPPVRPSTLNDSRFKLVRI